MTDNVVRLVDRLERSRDPGDVFRAARIRSQLDRTEFAAALRAELNLAGLSGQAIGAWEDGHVSIPPPVLAAAVRVARRQPATTALGRPATSEPAPAPFVLSVEPCAAPASARDALLYGVDVGSAVQRAISLSRSDLAGRSRPTEFSVTASVNVSRDWLLQHLTRAGRPSREESSDLHHAFSTFQDLDTQHGGGRARDELLRYLTRQVLRDPAVAGDPSGLGACAPLSELLYLAGLTAFDTGALGLAQRYFTQALRLAQEADCPEFAANIIAALSHVALTAGHPQEAGQLATVGLTGLRERDVPAVRMRLELMRARGHALSGEPGEARASADRAQLAYSAVTRQSTPRWARYLNDAFLAGELALVEISLGNAEPAIDWAQRSIDASRHRARRRLISYATLSRAHLQARDIDEAYSVAHEALDVLDGGLLPWRGRSALVEFAGLAETLNEPRAADGFHDRLHELQIKDP